MKKHVRKITIIAVTLLLPMLLILPITQAKRAKKSSLKPALTQPNASQANLPTTFNSLVRPQDSLTPVSAEAVNFGVSPVVSELPAPEQVEPDKDVEQNLKMVPNKIIRTAVSATTDDSGQNVAQDAAVQTSAPELNIPASTSFEGQSIFDTIALGQGFLPPDTVGDVGPNHYVQAVNLIGAPPDLEDFC